jgi:UDP-N-acetylglucosamine 2-epimerase (non-hydrolysing)
LNEIAEKIAIIFPVHPRTSQMMNGLKTDGFSSRLHLVAPVGYLECLALQQKATLVITDSGGIQEETTFLGIPCLTVRENTERPVTIQLGSNILVGRDMDRLRANVSQILSGKRKTGSVPPLWDGRSGERIGNIIAARES